MYNHKLRGRPDDPKNQAIAAAETSLAQTIQVSSLNPSFMKTPEPSEMEVARSRQHYNEFKKSYAMKHSAISLQMPVTKMPIIKESPNIDIYKLDNNSTPSRASLRIVETKKFSQRPRTQDKRVNVPSWTQDAEADYNRYPDDVRALMLLQKLREMEVNYTGTTTMSKVSADSKTSQYSQLSHYSQNVGTQSVLEQAEKEASVAQDQLEAIQRLLKVDKATSRPSMSLHTIKEEEEPHPKTKQKKLVEDVKEKISKSKKKNMVLTLNTLNQRIQQMHEKYFNEPRYKYLSLKDVKKRCKLEKNIETLYKNNEFDPEKEISEILLEKNKANRKSDSFDVIEQELIQHKTKPVNIVRKCMSIPIERHEFTADISSDNYLQNKLIKNVHFFDEVTPRPPNKPESDSDLDIGAESNEGSWINKNSNIFQTSSNKISKIPSSQSTYQSAKVDVLLSPQASGTASTSIKTASTLHSIQESILRSEYLMKEFDLTESNLTSGLSNYESSISMTRRGSHSKPSLPSLHQFFSATSRSNTGQPGHNGEMQRAFMEDSIRTQLKNSLYDIF